MDESSDINNTDHVAIDVTSTNGTPPILEREHEMGPDATQVGTDPSLGLERAPTPDPRLLPDGISEIEQVIETQGQNPTTAPAPPLIPEYAQTQGQGPTSAPARPLIQGQAGAPRQAPAPGQAGAPGQPPASGQPGAPGQPPAPGQAGVPGQADMPAQGGALAQPPAPGQAGAPGQPPVPGQAGAPRQAPAPGQAGAPRQAAAPGQAGAPVLRLPSQDLFANDRRQDFIRICSPLYKASMEGDWTAAQRISQQANEDGIRPPLVQYAITDNCETMLHIAASSSRSTDFVRNLVNMMRPVDLMYQNKNGNTALSLAAMTGNVDIAILMVEKNPELLKIANKSEMTPLLIAALYGKHDMVNYLYKVADRESWTYADYKWVCLKCVQTDLFDIALRIFPDIPDNNEGARETQDILGLLARKPSAFEEPKQHFMRRMIGCFKERPHSNTSKAMQLLNLILTRSETWSQQVLHDRLRGPVTTVVTQTSQGGQLLNQTRRTNPDRILFVAAEMGNIKFIVELLRKYPDLIWKVNDNEQNIFHVAVSRRHESIYNLLYEIGSMKNLIVTQKDRDGNTLLHTVAKNAKNNRLKDVSGAAFRMQRRLLWYKEVESMIPQHYTEKRNKDGLTPSELFSETHNKLLIESEKWMKGTASKCMLVATLIATVVFGVAFTIPGGYEQNHGYPIFRHNPVFIVFVVLDAISLILSATSILVFLSVLTSSYALEDFKESLPKKLMAGLTLLFLSILTMMIAFSVSFFVLYHHKFNFFIGGSISVLALVPIVVYILLHFPLLKDMYHSTYGSKSLFNPKKQMLYYKNPNV
ncbi:uncharacterized protein [Rutidosis leptorrhynchoides]|uniref:uncharacterized protein n=1 Tax=Rutidosis leptorrhynchoides TaxID=125765 RepID=UPI003A990C63